MGNMIKDRPTSVTIIGWIFIGVAGLIILSGAMGFMTFTFMKQTEEKNYLPMPEGLPGHFKVMWGIFRYFDTLAILQILFALFIIITCIQFLKLRAWARAALEGISWLGLVFVAGFGIFWIISWISATSGIAVAESTAGPPSIFGLIGIVMGVTIMAIWAVPLVVIIKFLRGIHIREAVTQVRG
jgi:hypothetical protein